MKPSRAYPIAMVVFFTLFLSACGTKLPLGMDEAEWNTLSSQQRLDARAKQAELDQAREQRRTAEAQQQAAQTRLRELEAARQLAELEKFRCEARYGDRVQCVLHEAQIYRSRQWQSVQPIALDVVRGTEVEAAVHQQSERSLRTIDSVFGTFDGQTFTICRDSGSRSLSQHNCIRLVGTFEDFRRGINRPVEAPEFLRGKLRCSLAPAEGMPSEIIIRR
ncbi:hypothetical protein Selin_1671 [Desulfurispirillum indicum S5]|uniref:Lipoprotein n=1 Tax=Desulfurispirillum indicum (strain ATCC BAA-1389 / DSM 22839 / S5) TaxID=653733 RepID=E6W0Q6_DESIS|nr:hypothetical protein [Desulfurispirillum indicum]ADU66401.1 hypothetical protein Selin_1671 [Desulfurispirillum indicum S5]